MMSQRDTKTDIKKVGETPDDQNVYRFRYKGSPMMQLGLMADEVARQHPEAVGVRPDGLMAVDYGKATQDAARMGGAVREGGDYARGRCKTAFQQDS